jgi:hypothetical protein
LADEFGLSKSCAHRAVEKLRERGWVGHMPGCSRSLALLRPVEVPVDRYEPYEWSLAPALQAAG